MDSRIGLKIIDIEIDYILSEFSDQDTVHLLEQTVHGRKARYKKLKHLQNAIMSGKWTDARETLSLLELPSTAISALNEHVAKELIWQGGNALQVLKYVKSHIKTAESISIVAGALLQTAPNAINERRELYQRVLHRPGLATRLQALLDNALQFKSISTKGLLPRKKSACLVSFVYCDIYLNFLQNCSSVNCLEKLRILIPKVRRLNEFNSHIVSANLRALLNQCILFDDVATLKLLRKSPIFTQAINKIMDWTPFSPSGFSTSTPRFDFLQEYGSRRTRELPPVNNIFELGYVIEAIKNPNSVSITAEFDEILISPRPVAEFPLVPMIKISLGSQVWSLASNWKGQLLAVGLSSTGSVPIYTRDELNNWSISETLAGNQYCERLSFNNVNNRLLLSRGGTIEARSLKEKLPAFEMSEVTERISYGCICWHPKNADLFYAARDSDTTLGLYDLRQRKLISRWHLPDIPSVIVSSGQHIVILTEKVFDHLQRLLLLDPTTSVLREVELPTLQADRTYSTLECSRWDSRMMLLMSSPNCIYLVDKLGKWPTRVIYGPKQRDCMMKARFCGPMDKFIIASSEESKNPAAFIFNRITGELVKTLVGHLDQVNDVEWICAASGVGPCIATASDDRSILIYGLPPA